MEIGSTVKVQLVRCPNCRLLLPEAADVPVYKCGGCSTDLQDNGKPSAFAYCSFKVMRLICSVPIGTFWSGVIIECFWTHKSLRFDFGFATQNVSTPEEAHKGLRMDRDVFLLAKEYALAIIFIDEVDAITTARFDAQTGAVREVQRILMELLNQMDGFEQTVNVKVCTAKMNLSDEVDLEDYVSWPDKISASESPLLDKGKSEWRKIIKDRPKSSFCGNAKLVIDKRRIPAGRIESEVESSSSSLDDSLMMGSFQKFEGECSKRHHAWASTKAHQSAQEIQLRNVFPEASGTIQVYHLGPHFSGVDLNQGREFLHPELLHPELATHANQPSPNDNFLSSPDSEFTEKNSSGIDIGVYLQADGDDRAIKEAQHKMNQEREEDSGLHVSPVPLTRSKDISYLSRG
ncbi:hypothetical protein Q3G72_020083 [Acer saccharum]|nr:hypothetical protein Q3G72_020083 [Acer saccharum]